jgi:hypothetical protein
LLDTLIVIKFACSSSAQTILNYLPDPPTVGYKHCIAHFFATAFVTVTITDGVGNVVIITVTPMQEQADE